MIDSSVITEFETYYKSKCNKLVYDSEGKEFQRAESRPLDCTTYFTTKGDSVNAIGEGAILAWDFGNQDNEIIQESGSLIRRKRIEFKFLDTIYIKEGTMYFHNTLKGSYLDLYVVCPQNNYYYDNNGIPKLATEDKIISHYIINQFLQGSCPMGNEFNTESCSGGIPVNYKFWLEVTVPAEDEESNGYVTLEIYRKRTVIL